jgi:hypothetical protein
MTETIARQYEIAGVTPLMGWPRVNEMGEHAMVQKVKYRLENNGQDGLPLLQVFKPCVNVRREFRSWKYKCDKDGKPVATDAFEKGNEHTLDCIKGFIGTNPTYNTWERRWLFVSGSSVFRRQPEYTVAVDGYDNSNSYGSSRKHRM